jgi:hypothetical protein
VAPRGRGSGWRRWVERRLPPIVDVACRAAYRIERHGLENITHAPSTLIVANHRRDSDALLIASLFYDRKGFSPRGELPYFVAREDLFHRGFLLDYLERWPAPLREALGWINVGPILRAGHAHPMRRVPERTLGEVLEDVRYVLGDQPLDQVLRPRPLAAFERLAGEGGSRLRVRDVLGRRFRGVLRQRYGLRRLTRACFRALVPYERSVIRNQLQLFVNLLERGHTLLLEPEGLVSVTGEFLRIRRGIHVLLNAPRVGVRVLPVGIAYDFMSVGRREVFMSVGPELQDLKGASRHQVSERVTDAILRQTTVTTSELASRVLLQARRAGAGVVTTGELVDGVRDAARRHAAVGARLDPRLLDGEGCATRVHSFLAFCRRKGIVEAVAGDRWRLDGRCSEATACFNDPQGAVACACNELRSLERVHPELAERAAG